MYLRNLVKSIGFLGMAFLIIQSGLLNLKAQTYPFWDVSPDYGVPGSPSAIFGKAAASGPDLFIVGQNLDSSSESYGPDDIWTWSECSGWRKIALSGSSFDDLTIHDGYLYAVGTFTGFQDVNNNTINATYIAKYEIASGQWSAVPTNGLDRAPDAITIDDSGTVYIGIGKCNQIMLDGKSMEKLAGTNWVGIGKGLNQIWESEGGDPENDNDSGVPNVADAGVFALATDGTNIFAAGGFLGGTNSDGTYVQSHCLIKWDGTNWLSMGGVDSFNGSGGGTSQSNHDQFTMFQLSLAVQGTNLFVAGSFNCICGSGSYPSATGLARFSTVTRQPLPCDELGYGTGLGRGNVLAMQGTNVYVMGGFTSVGSTSANGIAKWNGGTSSTWSALGIGLTNVNFGNCYMAGSDNAIYVSQNISQAGGWFDHAGGILISNTPVIARWVVGPDTCSQASQIDFTYNAATDGTINDLAIQDDGKALIVGSFGAVDGQSCPGGVVRLNIDGTIDTTFDANNVVTNCFGAGNVLCGAIDSLHRVYLGGFANTGGGVFLRVNQDGLLDVTSDGNTNLITADNAFCTISGSGHEISIGPEGSDFTIGGAFSEIEGVAQYGLVDILIVPNTNSCFVMDSYTSMGAYPGLPNAGNTILAIAASIAGPVGGDIASSYGDYEIVNPNYPNTYNALTYSGGADGLVYALAFQPNGKVLVGGYYQNLGSGSLDMAAYGLGRFNTNGIPDTTFNAPYWGINSSTNGFYQNGYVSAVCVQSDGKILVGGGGGMFWDGSDYQSLVRLNSDGSVDNSFNIHIPDAQVNKIVQATNGDVIVVGQFNTVNGVGHTNIVRFTTN